MQVEGHQGLAPSKGLGCSTGRVFPVKRRGHSTEASSHPTYWERERVIRVLQAREGVV